MAVPIRTLVTGQLLWLVSIYVPYNPEDRRTFYKKDMHNLLEYMAVEGKAADVVLVGMDANAVAEPCQDIEWESYEQACKSLMSVHSDFSLMCNAWMDVADLSDTWKRHHQGLRAYTRLPQAPTQVAKRIDYILINRGSENCCLDSGILPALELPWQSDHAATFIDVVSLPIVREELSSIYQRPIFSMDEIDNKATDIKAMLGKASKDTLASLWWGSPNK